MDRVVILTQTPDPEIDSFQAGPFAFWTFVILGVVTVVLILSMRKQFRRIDFDENGATDAERRDGVGTPSPAGNDDEDRLS